jgi:hypothetical protein
MGCTPREPGSYTLDDSRPLTLGNSGEEMHLQSPGGRGRVNLLGLADDAPQRL